MIKVLLLIGTGSFCGGILRYLISQFAKEYLPGAFPFGTFAVNILGCFLIGVFYGLSEHISGFSPELRTFLTIGFCGGFTTFSTFANESLSLLKGGNALYFALYAGLSVFLGILAVYLGNCTTKFV
ncbi:MAG: fluoride efflux transporter CrcB [Fibrobacteraceae bacterium]|nr:fluoride efflux transporter CrcB [Fibrobacteraceae bacterium]